MILSDLMAGQPAPRRIAGARSAIRKQLHDSGRRLVVVDDDPTGTQTVHEVLVYMEWSVERLSRAFASGAPVFYISTNSRSLGPVQATQLNLELARSLAAAARRQEAEAIVASRSDSTLRGHFPHEVEALGRALGQGLDGVLIAPAFFEAGRYTVGDVHWVDQAGELISAEQSESARDPVFGYRHGNLKEWVEEKTGGAVKASAVRSISLDMIRRGGPDAVARELIQAGGAQPIILNAACYEDLEVLALGIAAAESQGKRFIYRCAASFVKARGGFSDRPLLERGQMRPGAGPGLVVVGSYVERTSRQVERLLRSRLATGVELGIEKLLDPRAGEQEIASAAERANRELARGRTACVYSSRVRHSAQGDQFLQVGNAIMSGLCAVVGRVHVEPGFLVAKGGITSIEIARSALGVAEATVLGQILEGVPVWRLGTESRWSEIPYVVFPGNVGGDEALERVVSILLGFPEIESGGAGDEVR